MATTLPEILSAPNLLGLVEKIKDGLPTNHLPPGLLGQGATMRRTEGNTFSVIRAAGTFKTAKQTAYGAASRGGTASGMSDRPGVTITSAENVELKAADLMNLMEPDGSGRQAMGRSEVARIVRECTTKCMNLRNATLTSMLANDNAWFDVNGNLLPSSSNAVVTVNTGIPAANRNQISSIIGTTWATDTVDVQGDLAAIHDLAARTTGYPLKHAIYGANILQYLQSNDEISEFWNRSPAAQDALMKNTIPNGFAGLTWWRGSSAFFQDADGTNQSIIGGDTIIFLPEPDPSWYEWVEGTTPIPTGSFGTSSDLSALLASATAQQGMYGYAVGQTDPLGGKYIYGDNFMPHIRVPEAIFVADVTP